MGCWSLVLQQPTKRMFPFLSFPTNDMPCHLVLDLELLAVVRSTCQFGFMCGIKMMCWRDWESVVLVSLCWYLCMKDLAVRIGSIGLGCLASNMTWFLWNQMHQSVVSNKGNALELWFGSILPAKRSWIHVWTVIWFCMSALVLMSTPSQTAFVKWHWRKRWLIISVSVWHNRHTGSQLIRLRHSSVLRGSAFCRNFQVNVSILCGMRIF